LSRTNSIGSGVRLDVAIDRIIENLPDSTQVGFAIRRARDCRACGNLTSRPCGLTPTTRSGSLASTARLAAGSQYCD